MKVSHTFRRLRGSEDPEGGAGGSEKQYQPVFLNSCCGRMDHRACREIEVQRQEALGQERAKSRRDELGAGGQDGGQLCMRVFVVDQM